MTNNDWQKYALTKGGVTKGQINVVSGGRGGGKSTLWASYLEAILEKEMKDALALERAKSVSTRTLLRLDDLMWAAGSMVKRNFGDRWYTLANFLSALSIAVGAVFGAIMLLFAATGMMEGHPLAYMYVSGAVLAMIAMIYLERNSKKTNTEYIMPFSLAMTPIMFSWFLLLVVLWVWIYSYREKRHEKQQDFEDILKGKVDV